MDFFYWLTGVFAILCIISAITYLDEPNDKTRYVFGMSIVVLILFVLLTTWVFYHPV